MVRCEAGVLGGPTNGGRPGEQDELLVDAKRVIVEINSGVGEGEALALTHPGVGGENDEGTVAIRDGIDEGVNGGGAQWPDLVGHLLGQLRALAR